MFTSVGIFVWNVHQCWDFCVSVMSFNAGFFFIGVLFTCIEFFIAMFTSVGFLHEMIFVYNVHQCRDFSVKCSPVLRFLCEMFTSVGFLCEMFTSVEILSEMFTSVGFLCEMFTSVEIFVWNVHQCRIFVWNVHQCRDFCVKCSPV
jgi:hypothetical protein